MMKKEQVKKEMKNLLTCLDFASNQLKDGKAAEKKLKLYFQIYQQLGLAWEYLGLHCKHWNGYKKGKNNLLVCKICGKVKGAGGNYLLVPINSPKKIGQLVFPNSKKTFKNKTEATVVNDTVAFHGALLNVDVSNLYFSNLLKHNITIADDRIITLRERDVECRIDRFMISVDLIKKKRVNTYSGFAGELSKKLLNKFPVVFQYDDKGKLQGLSIFHEGKKR